MENQPCFAKFLYFHGTIPLCTPVNMYTCTHVHLYTCTPVNMLTSTNVHRYKCSPIHLNTCTPVHLYTCIPAHLKTNTPVCKYIGETALKEKAKATRHGIYKHWVAEEGWWIITRHIKARNDLFNVYIRQRTGGILHLGKKRLEQWLQLQGGKVWNSHSAGTVHYCIALIWCWTVYILCLVTL